MAWSTNWYIYAQQMSYPHALRGNIDAKSINVQVTAKFLASVNWRNVFANDRHVDDYLSSCMHILSDIITQSVSVTSARINKAKSILPKHIRRLIKRKRRLWIKLKIKLVMQRIKQRVNKSNRCFVLIYLIVRKNYLITGIKQNSNASKNQ